MTLIPKKVFDQHSIVLGKTGAGKSSVLRSAFIEPLLDQDEPVCIIDPKGDHWGLKSSASGKRAGYPVVIFGGDHADIPLNVRAGADVAELVATGNRPCIIDLGGWMVGERTRFFIEFAQALFKHTRGKRWLIMDEVHNFCPQGKILDPDSGRMLHWANRLASEGRGRGITIVAASQRPQKVHKDFVTSMETLIAMRVIHPRDREAMKDWIDGCADPAKGKEVLTSLAEMPRGEAWVWSPEINFGPKRIKFPLFKTYDSFKPQPVSQKRLKGWAEIDLDEVRQKLASVVEEHKANDPAELRRRIHELERQLRERPKANVQVEPQIKVERVEVPVIKNGQFRQAEKIVAGMAQVLNRLSPALEVLQEGLRKVGAGAEAVAPRQAVITTKVNLPPTFGRVRLPEPKKAMPKAIESGGPLPRGELAVLTACIQFPDGLRREQLTVLTGYKRSSRDAYVARLKEKGFVATHGNIITATEAGRQAAPNIQPLPTGIELQNYWLAILPEGERKILALLLEVYPGGILRDEIDAVTGYKRSSRDAFLSRMAAKQLIEITTRGEVRASADLF